MLTREASLGEWITAYCANLREHAAGRAGKGEFNLVDERARLAKEQADRVARENAVADRELAPVALLETTLAQLARQLAGILEAIPVKLKRHTELSADQLTLVTSEINAARELAANVRLEVEGGDGPVGDPAGDPLRAAAA